MAELNGPLSVYMLPHLTARALAAARTSCRGLRQLVDDAPLKSVKPGMAEVLPGPMADYADSSQGLQALLRRHGSAVSNPRGGCSKRGNRYGLQPNKRRNLWDTLWCPGWRPNYWAGLRIHAGRHNGIPLRLVDLQTMQLCDDLPLDRATACPPMWQQWLSRNLLLVLREPSEIRYVLFLSGIEQRTS